MITGQDKLPETPPIDAADLLITPTHGYRVAGEHWTTLGGKWGGHFKPATLAIAEQAHFQKL